MPGGAMVRLPNRRHIVLDLVFLALGLGGFALLAAYAHACDRL